MAAFICGASHYWTRNELYKQDEGHEWSFGRPGRLALDILTGCLLWHVAPVGRFTDGDSSVLFSLDSLPSLWESPPLL